ncbi:disease resistance protein RGA5-like [Triticum urartu]|uniref:Disease resistance protein RPM1 n=1 Tax=Triticum urartu TaxID=4572 RepID=A0A8R7VBT5_TRIUA|nr:disease resistance protein RGA5-like [Triticum urartu]XP_048548651.1 disease resistance protein RGA5-like [Triticum urartu]
MEVALVSVATGALNSVLEKLGTLLVDEYNRLKGVCGEIKFLTDELTAMHAFLLKMSEEEDLDVQDKVWMTMVRELSYDIEDSIDDFMQGLDHKDAKPDGFIKKIKHILGTLGKRKAHHRTFQDLKNQVIEAGERNQRYKTTQAFSNTKNATVDPRALAIFEDASKLVGIDEPKAEIIRLLTEGNVYAPVQQQQPKILSIVGSGGMGKTTLANQVYQDLKGKFECRAFVSVSRNPNMKKILRTILSEVANKDYAHTKARDEQQLISKISSFLVDKRYFVVVDDIWDVDTWNIIKCAFPTTSSSNRIITTTRMNNVAHLCCSSLNGHIYNIRPLDMGHSRQLFHRRIFKSDEDCPSHLQEISKKILRKCDGLPLAIIAISGLLANIDKTEDLWNEVKDSIGRALERNSSVEGMMKILSLSYFDLPSYLKTCLLYLSIYLEDSTIEMEGLIRRWIAEGFIHREGKYSAYEFGERCFNELLNRGLIQPGEIDVYQNVKSCRVHDTILDFIISKSIEENFVTILGVPTLTIRNQSKVVRRLCVQGVEKGNSAVLIADLVFSHVRSLTMVRGLLEIPSLEEFRHLHVLDLMNCSELEDHHLENIVRLFQLRYLNLKCTEISKLPEQIGRLGCLEVLDLTGTYVKELPASIVNLRKLMHLLVNDFVKFPDGIAKMQAIETLKVVNASIQPLDFLCGLGQLMNLRNLRIHLDFGFDSDTEDTNMVGGEHNKAIVSSLYKLGTQNLRSLTIGDRSGLLHEESLCLPTLDNLFIWFPAFPQPTWVGSLRNLQQLRLVVKRFKQDDLCTLGALPSLLVMYLVEQTESSGKLRFSGEVGFRFLKIFIYGGCLEPVDLMFGTGSMPKLEKLELNAFCMVEANSLGFGIENLPCLASVKCIMVVGDDGIVEAVKTAMERGASTHPNHPSLLFQRR